MAGIALRGAVLAGRCSTRTATRSSCHYIADPEPITPIPQPSTADPRKLALGERLFADRRLSHNNDLACASCHDLRTNGAIPGRAARAREFAILTVFNAAL